jgi:hypothetical protein
MSDRLSNLRVLKHRRRAVDFYSSKGFRAACSYFEKKGRACGVVCMAAKARPASRVSLLHKLRARYRPLPIESTTVQPFPPPQFTRLKRINSSTTSLYTLCGILPASVARPRAVRTRLAAGMPPTPLLPVPRPTPSISACRPIAHQEGGAVSSQVPLPVASFLSSEPSPICPPSLISLNPQTRRNSIAVS